MKIFFSNDVKHFLENLKSQFEFVKIFKPQACRVKSQEVYIICKKFL